MSYYMQGDFRGRGSYYRGDPGFFSFLGGLAKSALGAIPVVGPALGGVVDTIAGAVGKKAASSAIVKASEGTLASRASQMLGKGVGIVKKHPVMTAAAGAGALTGAGLLAHHLARGGGERKRRRMNPCNARALRRAIRRAHAFERLAKHVIGFSSPRKPKGRMYFRAKRKR